MNVLCLFAVVVAFFCIGVNSLTLSMMNMVPRSRIVVVGSANQDLTSYTSALPSMGETVMGSSFETSCGGKGANQAIAAVSLGFCPVTMICRVGDDVFGLALLTNLRRAGLDFDEESTVMTGRDSPASGVATIVVDNKSGDNMIIVSPGANHALTPAAVRKALLALPEPPAVVMVQLEIPAEVAREALKVGKELGAITILNPAPVPKNIDMRRFYPCVDILIPNETELKKLAGRGYRNEESMAKALLKKGVSQAVIVTLGARGALVVESTGGSDDTISTFVEAPKDIQNLADPIQDTIGAGDAFCGALATYITSQLDLVEAATLACGFAGVSVRRKGASYPKGDEIPQSLRLPMMVPTDPTPSITFVTSNKKKLEEVRKILSAESLPFDISSQKIDLPEMQGDPSDIAIQKCRFAAQTVQGACFAEDTSLCFNALNGMPGPYIKWFLESCGLDGLNKLLAGFDDKSAYAQTVVAFTAGPGEEIHLFHGRTRGVIVPPRGSMDFGWDPIFEPVEGGGMTYAEMSVEGKNMVSHRSRALTKLRQHLLDNSHQIEAKLVHQTEC